MSEHDVRWLFVVLVVLPSPDGGDMRGDSSVDGNILLSRVFRNGHAADYFEAVAVVDLLGDFPESGVKTRERESLLVNVA